MQPSIYPLIALMALGISMLGAMVVAFRIRKIVKYSAATVSIAVLPALVMLGLYYSLAIHSTTAWEDGHYSSWANKAFLLY